MKRSEMLNILGQAIYDHQECDSHDLNAILEILERAGMKPPRNNKQYNYYVHTDAWDYIDDLHDWDEE